jgi:release factor glutamine methyltransferase
MKLREPFQYLLASAHWREYILSVSAGVLIPRPETEIFPDLVSKALKENPWLASHPWADLGTGSGVIAISTAAELKKYNQVIH